MNDATPRPWRVDGFDILAELPDFANTGIVTAVAAHFSDVDGGSVALDRETLTANLEFIVEACNAYEGTDGKYGVAEENPLTPELTCGDCKVFAGDYVKCENGQTPAGKSATACVKIVPVEPATA